MVYYFVSQIYYILDISTHIDTNFYIPKVYENFSKEFNTILNRKFGNISNHTILYKDVYLQKMNNKYPCDNIQTQPNSHITPMLHNCYLQRMQIDHKLNRRPFPRHDPTSGIAVGCAFPGGSIHFNVFQPPSRGFGFGYSVQTRKSHWEAKCCLTDVNSFVFKKSYTIERKGLKQLREGFLKIAVLSFNNRSIFFLAYCSILIS